MYQAILIHTIFSIIRNSISSLGLDLKPTLPAIETDLLASLVMSCRRLGMFYYPNMLARYQSDDLASYVWVGIEEVKRFDVALYKVCRALSSSERDGSIEEGDTPRATSWQLSASEPQFLMPQNDLLWNAVGEEEWASAAAKDVGRVDLSDIMEAQWIAKVGRALRAYPS
jgi:hypothetical protein